jgi:hypothetical protein
LKGTSGLIGLYSIHNFESYTQTKDLVIEILSGGYNPTSSSNASDRIDPLLMSILFIGAHTDADSQRQVSTKLMSVLANQFDFMFVESSIERKFEEAKPYLYEFAKSIILNGGITTLKDNG